MRRINRRLVLLSIVLVCDVVSVFGRPHEQNTPVGQLKGNRGHNKETLLYVNMGGGSLVPYF